MGMILADDQVDMAIPVEVTRLDAEHRGVLCFDRQSNALKTTVAMVQEEHGLKGGCFQYL